MRYNVILDALFLPENRRIGKTTIAAAFAKKVGGILVSFNSISARQIEKEHGVETRSIQLMDFIKGIHKPIIFDQDAFISVLESAIKLEERTDKLDNLADQVDALLSLAKRVRGKAIDDGDYWEISDDVFQEVQKAFEEIKVDK